MATFNDDFANFVSWRCEDAGEDDKRFLELNNELDAISENASNLAFSLAELKAEVCYRLGFRDAISFMAGA